MRLGWTVAAFFGAAVVVFGQAPPDAKTLAQLQRLFPAASGFSPKGGEVPVFRAYAGDPKAASPTVVGYAFYTTELQPLDAHTTVPSNGSWV